MLFISRYVYRKSRFVLYNRKTRGKLVVFAKFVYDFVVLLFYKEKNIWSPNKSKKKSWRLPQVGNTNTYAHTVRTSIEREIFFVISSSQCYSTVLVHCTWYSEVQEQ